MKKLLLLGGSSYLLPVIRKAHELGVYVITCDYLPDNIAHKYADEYANISILDQEKVLEYARKRKIDGIMSFACDPGVVTAAFVAHELHLPSPGPYSSIQILQNKGKFRQFLEENHFNVPTSKSFHSIEDALKDVNMFHFPVIVKPTDSAGSKGVTKVLTKEELKDSINYALTYSHSNEFIIEDFLEKKGHSSDCDSFTVNGKLAYLSFSSQRFDDNSFVPAAYSWPSTMSIESQKYLESELNRLFDLLNMQTGLYNIETRECLDGKAYIMECSPRGGGNRLAEMMQYIDGVSLIESSIKAALGMKIDNLDIKKTNHSWCEIILHSNDNGLFQELWIDDSIKENIIEKDLWVKENDEVKAFNGANATIGTLILKFSDAKRMEEVLNNVDKYIKVVVK